MKSIMTSLLILLFCSQELSAEQERMITGSTFGAAYQYTVTLRRVQMHKSKDAAGNSVDEWITVVDNFVNMDIASVNAGESVANLVSGYNFDEGTYDILRFAIKPGFTVAASVADSDRGGYMYTSTTTTGTADVGSFTGLAQAAHGSTLTSHEDVEALSDYGAVYVEMSLEGEEMQSQTTTIDNVTYFFGDMTFIDPFVVDNETAPEDIFLDFRVEESIEFYYDSGADVQVFIPGGPQVTLTTQSANI